MPRLMSTDQTQKVGDIGAFDHRDRVLLEEGAFLVKPTISRTWTCSGQLQPREATNASLPTNPHSSPLNATKQMDSWGPIARAAARSTATALALSSAPGVPGTAS